MVDNLGWESILKKMLRKAIVILIVVLLAFPVLAKLSFEIGEPAPVFELPALNGKIVSSDKVLGKNATVLYFFTSWSRSCQNEVLFLKDLYKEYNNDGLEIVGISFDRKLENLASFINENGITFALLHDKKLKTIKDFRILIIPTLFVLDQAGNINNLYVDFDQNVAEAITKDIKKLLVP